MRASRLVELLVRLQLRGGAPASELAEALGVSVRTVYRDIEALSAAGVPVWTEVGRYGGVRIDPAYRIAGLPRLDPEEARGLLFAVVPSVADQLGLDAAAADRTLLPALERSGEDAARAVRDRLVVEPTHWFVPPEEHPCLTAVARAVWDSRELRVRYRDEELTVQPYGLVLKGATWYLLGRVRAAGRAVRLFRVARVTGVDVLDHRFERPPDLDLAREWAAHREAFLVSLPDHVVRVRVAPAAEPLLPALDEARLDVPPDVPRDEAGWALVELRFETLDRAARHLARLGADVEVLAPAALRERMATTAAAVAAVYAVTPAAARAPARASRHRSPRR